MKNRFFCEKPLDNRGKVWYNARVKKEAKCFSAEKPFTLRQTVGMVDSTPF
jgi:hypothetical protein